MGFRTESPKLVSRDRELLSTTLDLLASHGYDRLTVDAVAATAHASKATIYRRWPSKADLVLAALSEGIRQVAVPPNTGSLRSDLLWLGRLMADYIRLHAGTIRALLAAMPHNSALTDFFRDEFLEQRKSLIEHTLRQAVARGEIDGDTVGGELWDVLPGYLVYRSVFSGRPTTRNTVRALVDDVIIPGLTRQGH